MEPTYSPWGEIQDCETLCPGVYMVTPPGHGGIMAEREGIMCLAPAARKCGFMNGGYLCFEEDCQEQVVLRDLLDSGQWELPASRVKDPAAFCEAINRNIQQYNPDYWKVREKRMERSIREKSRPAPGLSR